MSLTNVWVQTQADGLVRADQIAGISAVGTISVEKEDPDAASSSGAEGLTTSEGGIRFRFVPFPVPAPSDRADAEHL